MIASQDPLSVNQRVIELSDILILHKMTSPKWFEHIRGRNIALKNLTMDEINQLSLGEGYVWAKDSTDPEIMNTPKKILIRPRITKHGAETKTAI